jgi:hypothetical protein
MRKSCLSRIDVIASNLALILTRLVFVIVDSVVDLAILGGIRLGRVQVGVTDEFTPLQVFGSLSGTTRTRPRTTIPGSITTTAAFGQMMSRMLLIVDRNSKIGEMEEQSRRQSCTKSRSAVYTGSKGHVGQEVAIDDQLGSENAILPNQPLEQEIEGARDQP